MAASSSGTSSTSAFDRISRASAQADGHELGPLGVLVIHLQSARDLRAADRNGKSDPYVVASLVGRPDCRWTSGTKWGTLNPRWDQTHEWPGFLNDLCDQQLKLKVWDRDLTSFDDPLGECVVTLSELKDAIQANQARRSFVTEGPTSVFADGVVQGEVLFENVPLTDSAFTELASRKARERTSVYSSVGSDVEAGAAALSRPSVKPTADARDEPPPTDESTTAPSGASDEEVAAGAARGDDTDGTHDAGSSESAPAAEPEEEAESAEPVKTASFAGAGLRVPAKHAVTVVDPDEDDALAPEEKARRRHLRLSLRPAQLMPALSGSNLKAGMQTLSTRITEVKAKVFEQKTVTSGTITFTVSFKLKYSIGMFPGAPVHASAPQALRRPPPHTASCLERLRDRTLIFLGHKFFLYCAVVWALGVVGWGAFVAMLYLGLFLLPPGALGMDEGALKYWINVCIQVLTGQHASAHHGAHHGAHAHGMRARSPRRPRLHAGAHRPLLIPERHDDPLAALHWHAPGRVRPRAVA